MDSGQRPRIMFLSRPILDPTQPQIKRLTTGPTIGIKGQGLKSKNVYPNPHKLFVDWSLIKHRDEIYSYFLY
jgi:hypothetical protein